MFLYLPTLQQTQQHLVTHKNSIQTQKRNISFTVRLRGIRRKLQPVYTVSVAINGASDWLYSGLGFGCGEARLNDLHRVVVSYRPVLKALAGHTETQGEEMGFRGETHWGGTVARLIADQHVR